MDKAKAEKIRKALKLASEDIASTDRWHGLGEFERLSSNMQSLTKCLHTIVEILESE